MIELAKMPSNKSGNVDHYCPALQKFDDLSSSESSYDFKSEPASEKPKVSLKEVLLRVRRIERRTENSGAWPHEPNELIRELINGERPLDDSILQAELLDWIESEVRNKFLNLTTEETI